MDKGKMINMLNKAIQHEEMAIPIYTKHLATVLQWSGLGAAEEEEIKQFMLLIIKDSKKHKAILESLKKNVEVQT